MLLYALNKETYFSKKSPVVVNRAMVKRNIVGSSFHKIYAYVRVFLVDTKVSDATLLHIGNNNIIKGYKNAA